MTEPLLARRLCAGLATVITLATVVIVSAGLFRGDFTESRTVIVVAPRAGLVMNPDAKVKLLGVQVGHVTHITDRADGNAELQLAIDPSQISLIPANVVVHIASTTVFGAKYVRFVPPPDPDLSSLRPGQVLSAGQVTVEINTLFEKLTSLLGSVDPGKLNATLATISGALNGRGRELGQTFVDLDNALAKLEPSHPALEYDLATAPAVIDSFADAAPDIIRTVANTTELGRTLVDQQNELDALLLSTIGLGEIGTDTVGANRQPLTDVLRLLVPTTDLTAWYRDQLRCGLQGIIPIVDTPPSPLPGVEQTVSLSLGLERYRYPANLPKVAASGLPSCTDVGLPNLPFEGKPKFVVADVGANPWKYGNQGILLNSDGLKQALFGPLDGPPRNSAQVGQPG